MNDTNSRTNKDQAKQTRWSDRRSFLAGMGGLAASASLAPAAGLGQEIESGEALVLKAQGSFAIGGTVITGANGDTFHGDHAYVQYQIPQNPRDLPLVMWHGGGQFSKTWESTPDGRDGYQNIFLRRGFSTYIIDEPRRGRAGRTTIGTTIPNAVPGESVTFNIFRLGVWDPPNPPSFWPDTQFPASQAALDQYWRQQTPATGPGSFGVGISGYETKVSAVSALFDKTGPGVLLTHSASGGPGWLTAIRNNKVRGVIAYEPTEFVFPEGEVPTLLPAPSLGLTLAPLVVSPADFTKLTRIPIQIVYGDHIPTSPPSERGYDLWYATAHNVQLFVNAVNSHGGRATILNLPDVGIRGNTHFAFSDLNNIQVADLLSEYLEQNHLDRR
jgi:hypothetical protein